MRPPVPVSLTPLSELGLPLDARTEAQARADAAVMADGLDRPLWFGRVHTSSLEAVLPTGEAVTHPPGWFWNVLGQRETPPEYAEMGWTWEPWEMAGVKYSTMTRIEVRSA